MFNQHNSHAMKSRSTRGAYGRVNDGTYRSSQFDYTVTWGAPWSLVESDGSIDADPGTDRMVIGSPETRHAQVEIVGGDRRNLLGPAETVAFWSSADYLSDFMEPETVVVLSGYTRSSGIVVMVSPGGVSGDAVVTVKESYDIPRNASIRVTLTVDLDAFQDVYQSLQANVQINGQALLRECPEDVLLTVLPSL